jgi:PAS domain S-box-containing protein
MRVGSRAQAVATVEQFKAESVKRENESRINEQEQYLDGILSNIVSAVVTIDQHGAIKTFNASAENMFDYQEAEIVGQSIEVLFPDHIAVNILMTGNREVSASRKDGSHFPAELNVGSMTVGDGVVFIASMHDISQKKQVHTRLQESERHYRELVENAPYAIIVTQRDGIIKFANPSAVKLFRAKSADQLIGKDNLVLLHPDYQETAATQNEKVFNGQSVPLAKDKRIRVDGTEFMSESSGSHCVWNGEPSLLIGIRDHG